MSKVFVGGLSFRTTEESLRGCFEQVGAVSSARIITDRETGRSRGFGFVEMGSAPDAEKAIAQLDGKELDERVIRVSIANETTGPRSGPRNGPRERGNFGDSGAGSRGRSNPSAGNRGSRGGNSPNKTPDRNNGGSRGGNGNYGSDR